jgi:Phosphotransferase enzyme family
VAQSHKVGPVTRAMSRSTQPPVPESPRELTPEWLTAALTQAGVLRGGAVTNADWERVGQEYGFTGLIGRVSLRYERAVGDPPASLIAKLPMAIGDVASGYRARQERDPSLRQRYYDRCVSEVRFYREIGAPFAPECYYSSFDDTDRRVVLLLEDVSGRQGDVLDGCSIEDAALVIEKVAPFHARWWGERAPADAFPRSRGDPHARQERYAQSATTFLTRHGDGLPSGVRSVVELLRSRLARMIVALDEGPQTLIHADLHLDNLIFDVRGSGRSVAVLDWQTTSVGSPAWDLVLFLFGSLAQEDRRATEDALLERYAELLAAHGVAGYSGESLRRDSRLALLALFAGTIVWIASLDANEMLERERALKQAAIADGRLMSAVLDHDVAELLEGLEPLNL